MTEATTAATMAMIRGTLEAQVTAMTVTVMAGMRPTRLTAALRSTAPHSVPP